MKTYWIAKPGEPGTGPFIYEQIEAMWKSGSLTADMLICDVESDAWTPLARAMAAAEKAKPTSNAGVYRVLGLLLGFPGVHNFYAGEVAAGIWQLVLMLIGVFLLFLGQGLELIGAAIFLLLTCWVLSDVIKGPPQARESTNS